MDPVLQATIDGAASGLKFEDPKLSRPASIAAGTKNLEEARKRRQLGKGKEALIEDRSNPEMEAIIAADPVEFMRKQLTEMLVKETAVNAQLYTMTPIDNKALSDSTNRLISLGNALKALPSQTVGANVGSQISLAEAIQQALEKHGGSRGSREVEVFKHPLKDSMMSRAESNFGVEK
jgi:hypothetical protein